MPDQGSVPSIQWSTELVGASHRFIDRLISERSRRGESVRETRETEERVDLGSRSGFSLGIEEVPIEHDELGYP
jgi:hypothetical protein